MKVNAGSAQGVSAGGVLEFLSLTNGNLSFLEDDEGWKYIDDTNFIEVINLTLAGLSSFNFKQQVCSDIPTDAYYLSPTNLNSQQTINKICEWSKLNYMKLNFLKTKYMVINFCRSAQFNTRLTVENNLLEQVQESRILGVTVTDDLKWHKNTANLVKEANKRMIILRKLISFDLPKKDLVHIYTLYIRSVVEKSCVVWGSSITEVESLSLERIQKCALAMIYRSEYESYLHALSLSGLSTLSLRRRKLHEVFAVKCIKNENTKHMFPLNNKVIKGTRTQETFHVPFAYHERLRTSAIPTMARYLNTKY